MAVSLRREAFDPWGELNAFQAAHSELAGKVGAAAVFVGTMRDVNQGIAVQTMTLEHYPAMTQKYLEKLCQEAASRWDILEPLVVHRYGELAPNDPIVLVGVWAAHREPAFAACRYLIDELKTRAPFWKQEATDEPNVCPQLRQCRKSVGNSMPILKDHCHEYEYHHLDLPRGKSLR